MKEVVLTPKGKPDVPLEAEVICPDEFAGKSEEEIAALEVYEGNTTVELGEYFDVEGNAGDSPEDTRIVIDGDVPWAKLIGYNMSAGEILVEGDVGRHAGAEMKGGKLIVEGDADDWLGREMKGGDITVHGNAGNYVGSTYRGEWRGMSGGRILVKGDAGDEIGEWMSDGKIIVEGNAGIMIGIHMQGGTIVVRGDVGVRPGAQMEGGTIVVCGRAEDVLPSFRYGGLEEDPVEEVTGTFHLFTGDYANGPKVEGKLYLNTALNEVPR
ncbi:formylmethanofuran dehydrogenase subunit C [Methanopyrus sp.]